MTGPITRAELLKIKAQVLPTEVWVTVNDSLKRARERGECQLTVPSKLIGRHGTQFIKLMREAGYDVEQMDYRGDHDYLIQWKDG